MFRYKLLIAVVAVVMVAASLAPAALAGGWSVVTAPNFPEEAVAGQEFTIDFNVLQHGVTPLDGLQPLVKLTDSAGGESQVFKAVGEGGRGHYVARVVLSRPGSWQCVIEAFEGDHPMPSLMVRPAVAGPASADRAGEFETSTMASSWLPVAVAALLVLSALAIALVSRPRWRGRSGHVG